MIQVPTTFSLCSWTIVGRHFTTVVDNDINFWLVAFADGSVLNLANDIHSFHNVAEDDVLIIQVGCSFAGDEKLTSVGIRAGVGHAQLTSGCVLDDEVFVGKLFAVNRAASSTVSVGKVTTYERRKEWV
jgi:carbonic anhydrase/acetyltransferase-like protein (isoleucine patch superfamily)